MKTRLPLFIQPHPHSTDDAIVFDAKQMAHTMSWLEIKKWHDKARPLFFIIPPAMMSSRAINIPHEIKKPDITSLLYQIEDDLLDHIDTLCAMVRRADEESIVYWWKQEDLLPWQDKMAEMKIFSYSMIMELDAYHLNDFECLVYTNTYGGVSLITFCGRLFHWSSMEDLSTWFTQNSHIYDIKLLVTNQKLDIPLPQRQLTRNDICQNERYIKVNWGKNKYSLMRSFSTKMLSSILWNTILISTSILISFSIFSLTLAYWHEKEKNEILKITNAMNIPIGSLEKMILRSREILRNKRHQLAKNDSSDFLPMLSAIGTAVLNTQTERHNTNDISFQPGRLEVTYYNNISTQWKNIEKKINTLGYQGILHTDKKGITIIDPTHISKD